MPSVRVLLIGDAIMKGIQISLAVLEVFPCTTCPHPLLRLDFPMFLAAKRGIPQRWRDHGRGTGWPNLPVLCSSVAEDLLRNLWFLLGEGERSCSLRMPSQGVQGATVFLMSGQWAVVVGGACKKNCFELREFVCLRF